MSQQGPFEDTQPAAYALPRFLTGVEDEHGRLREVHVTTGLVALVRLFESMRERGLQSACGRQAGNVALQRVFRPPR